MSRKIDSLPPRPPSKLKVIVVGTARTSTSSLAVALQELGYNTANGLGHNYFIENLYPYWTEAVNAKYNNIGKPYSSSDFSKFIGKYEAITGWHCALMAEELIAAFPDAKIILTERVVDDWLESYNATVGRTWRFWNSQSWVFGLPPNGREYDFHVFKNIAFEASGGEDRERQEEWYLKHNAKIKEIVPKERLLVLKPGDGWKKLCEFMGKDVPSPEYPRAGGKDGFHPTMELLYGRARRRFFMNAAVGIGGFGVLVAVALRLMGRW